MPEVFATCKAEGCERPLHKKGWCLECFRKGGAERQRSYRARHPGRNAEHERRRYYAHLKETRSAKLAYYYRNRDKVLAKKRLRYYGLTQEQYEAFWEQQGGKCGICAVEFDEEKRFARDIHVDHCHETGRVRGLLCGSCNRGLGVFKDDRERLRKAILWLDQ